VKLNRRNKPERRDFIMTNQAFYIICRSTQQGQIVYKLTRRTALADISCVILSSLSDNYLVMQIPREYDNLIESDKKTEIVAILMECYEWLTGRRLPVQFQDRFYSIAPIMILIFSPTSITYKIKSGDTRELLILRNDMAQQAILKKAGRTLKVEIPSGLPRDTGTIYFFAVLSTTTVQPTFSPKSM
jgi:hypothetical protein